VQNNPLIIHNHIYKCAGTSLSKVFKNNFGENWIQYEDSTKNWNNNFRYLLQTYKNIKAISSHLLPVFTENIIENRKILPIILIRNPLDRIFSIYLFEKTLKIPSIFVQKAKELCLDDYILWRIDYDNMIVDYQSSKIPIIPKNAIIYSIEDFSKCLDRLEEQIIGFKGEEEFINVTNTLRVSLKERLKIFKREVSKKTYEILLERNQKDFALYNWVKEFSI
jgi:hypothetical protein